jgi:D-allose transport system ATP-binding protein
VPWRRVCHGTCGEGIMDTILQMKNICKIFPGVVALDNIDFELRSGEVHVILGENGAGKSTLVKILSGVYSPTSGHIFLNNKKFDSLTPSLSKSEGISIIYQELSVINEISIAENLYIGQLPEKNFVGLPVVDKKELRNRSSSILKEVGLNRSPDEFVRNLSISEKQLVEIARALTINSKIIIMDEPTSSLSIEETANLFSIIRDLKNKDVGIIYISHKLDEIPKIGDRVTVLKDGKYVGTKNVAGITIDQMVSMMVGRDLDRTSRLPRRLNPTTPKTILSVQNFTRKDGRVKDVSFDVKEGKILGFYGLIGSGRSELMEAIFGIVPREGQIVLNGMPLHHKDPYGGLRNKLAFITENRRETGFFSNFSIMHNISIVYELFNSKLGGLWGLTNSKQDKKIAEEQAVALKIKCSSVMQNINELSGGNQQKVLVGKWLASNSEVFIFDEPTKGIDVGSKSEIYHIIRQLCDAGKGVIIVSSDLPEILYISDRILVFSDGHIVAEFSSDDATEEKIIHAATHKVPHCSYS